MIQGIKPEWIHFKVPTIPRHHCWKKWEVNEKQSGIER